VQSDFAVFVNSGLHGSAWPNLTCAVVPAGVFGMPILARNTPQGAHAEMTLLPAIRASVSLHATTTFKPGSTVNIKVLQNYSPCATCSSLYCRLQEDLNKFSVLCGVHFTLEIVFAALYNIERPSCALHSHAFAHATDVSKHERNVQGIRNLLQAGVFVRPFQENDWRQLAASLIQDTLKARQVEDHNLRSDFKLLFGSLT
jgi:hypothetical protein